jgi:heavy metal sensor kinase
MNIRLRLTLWYTLILFLILAVFSVLVYIGLSYSLFVVVDDHLQREAAQVIGEIDFEAEHDDEEHEAEEHSSEHNDDAGIDLAYIPEEGVLWRILDRQGQPLIDPGYFDGARFEPAIVHEDQASLSYATLADGTPIRLYTTPFVIEQQGAGIVQIAESYRHIQDVQRQLVFLLAISIPFVLLITSAGGWFLAANALAPIDRITRAANQISAADLNRRLNLNLPDDEVGRLAGTFDNMLARLEDGFERQKRFIADASHELRTPLTILKGDVEVALNRPRTNDEYRETLEMVNQTADRLTALVEELFLLARADNKQVPLAIEPVNVSELLGMELNRLKPYALRKNISLDLNIADPLLIKADPAKLARLFINLIDNAIKYSESGGKVTITGSLQGDQVCVTVTDTGPGIPAQHLPHLFDRFYRVDKARARNLSGATGINSSGVGLGLSIAQWLAQVHGGRIEVASKVGQGTVFTVWLPLEPKSTEARL